MKTKLVTSYYAFHHDPPFWGHHARDGWYKYSLVSICNVGHEIICYTDEGDKGYNQLINVKEKFKLDNLTIKIFKLEDNPWQEAVYNIRINNPEKYNNINYHLYRRSSQIYWLKWLFMEKEIEPDINLYWIDCGLSTWGLFPKSSSEWGSHPNWDKSFEGEYYPDVEYRYFSFTKAFNPEAIERINNFHENKIINLCSVWKANDTEEFFEKTKINPPEVQKTDYYLFPVAGFWGGNSNVILDYIKKFYETVDKVLATENYICTEQEIMYYLYHKEPHLYKKWGFDTFYHEDWASKGAFSDGQIAFSFLFTKNLK